MYFVRAHLIALFRSCLVGPCCPTDFISLYKYLVYDESGSRRLCSQTALQLNQARLVQQTARVLWQNLLGMHMATQQTAQNASIRFRNTRVRKLSFPHVFALLANEARMLTSNVLTSRSLSK